MTFKATPFQKASTVSLSVVVAVIILGMIFVPSLFLNMYAVALLLVVAMANAHILKTIVSSGLNPKT